MKYSMFIGRWQPWHKGHKWLIDQRLNENKNVKASWFGIPMLFNKKYKNVKFKIIKKLNYFGFFGFVRNLGPG